MTDTIHRPLEGDELITHLTRQVEFYRTQRDEARRDCINAIHRLGGEALGFEPGTAPQRHTDPWNQLDRVITEHLTQTAPH